MSDAIVGVVGWMRDHVTAAAILLAVCLGGVSHAYADPEVAVQQITYPVVGQTAAQIRRSLDRNTPVSHDGGTSDAYTRWDIDWRMHWFESSRGTCRPTAVTTRVRIRMTLPELQDTDSLPPALIDRWERYRRALMDHEAGHADIGIAAARAIEARLMQMGDQATCSQLADAANRMAREIIDRHARMERQYDRDTRFGRRNGAVFP